MSEGLFERYLSMVKILIMLLVVVIGAVLLSFGVNSINNSKEKSLTLKQAFYSSNLKGYYAETLVDRRTDVFCIQSGIGMIGVRDSYFYFVKEKGTDYWIAVRTNEKWADEEFGALFTSDVGVKISGDYWMSWGYEVDYAIKEYANKMNLPGEVKTDCFIDAYSEHTNEYRITAGIMCLIFFFAFLYRHYQRTRSWYMGINVAIVVTWIIQIVVTGVFIVCLYQGNFLI